MNILSKRQTIERKNNEVCAITEYPLEDSKMDFAIAKITGRYPDEKYVVNEKCREMVYVQEGDGKVVVKDQERWIQTGDLILIEPGEKFYWEGSMNLFIFCTPAFTLDQHHSVE